MANLPNSDGSEFAAYGQLMRALMPRIRGVCIFGASGDAYWSSDMAVDEPMKRMVLESIRSATGHPDAPGIIVNDTEPTVILWLWTPGTERSEPPSAAVLLRCVAGTDLEARGLNVIHAMLRPALLILSRELISHTKVQQLRQELAGHSEDLDMLMNVSAGGAAGAGGDGDELKAVLRAATEHLKCSLAAIIVPEKGLVQIQQASGNTMDAGLVARAHRHLMSSVQVRQRALIVNEMQQASGAATSTFRLLACPVARADGRSIGVLALFRPLEMPPFGVRQARIAELLARRVSVYVASSYDTLTGVLNRPAFEQRVHPVLRRGNAGDRTLSVLAIDINRTHVVNEACGMHVGDRMIAQIGELIRQRLPPGALAARISGDRFALLLRAGLDEAARFGEALRAGAELLGGGIAASTGAGTLSVSISVGVAAVEPHVEEFTHAFAAAEVACKAANENGRNRVEIYREEDESLIRRYTDMDLVMDLRNALSGGRLQLSAQMLLPIGAIEQRPHFELLLRMVGSDGVVVGPDHFMATAQRYQLMPEIDRWVVGEALRQLQPHAESLRTDPVAFTINCSDQSLRDENFAQFVVDSIAASGIKPQALCFELAESAVVANLAGSDAFMRLIRRQGCGVALDDFGAGLSSLSSLRALPLTMLKIDGSFVRDVLRDTRAEFTIQAIAQLARSMSLATVAEHVETDEIRLAVARLGVDYAQGFAIGRPVPISEVLEQLPLYAAMSGGVRDQGLGCDASASGIHASPSATGTHRG
jgi:diguanylate cyclase (GGDEF)-like protein